MIDSVITIGIIMVAKKAWSICKASQQKFLALIGPVQTHAAKKLTQALGNLVARGKNRGLDSHELYRNLEGLLSLLCLDVCHHRVADQVRAVSTEIVREQHRAMRSGKRKIGDNSAGKLMLLLLWDPECAEVFEATKVDAGTLDTAPKREHLKQFRWVEIKPILRVADVQRAFRKSVEGIFDRAKEMHETQKKLADALLDYEGLLESSASDEALISKRVEEVEELRYKLQELSKLDRLDSPKDIPERGTLAGITVETVPEGNRLEWHRAAYPLLLLVNRFELSRALERRKREIAELFDAVGATDDERDEIERRIGTLYGVIHKRWSQDGWIKKQLTWDVFYGRGSDKPSPFFDRRFGGWRKATSKRRKRFLEHHTTFDEFKSPRQLTEEGVLGMVQTMEKEEDNIFVRNTRLNRELQEIYDRVQENTRHGKFDAVIADLRILVDRVSGRGKRKIYPPEMLSGIFSYLAFMYAYRGERLEEAVRLALRAVKIHDTWLARLAIGWCYHRQGKVRKAVKELEVAKSAASRAGSGLLPLVHLVLGDACRDAKWHRKAQQAWQAGWELANAPEWKEQPGLTPFEVDERAGLRKALSENLADS